MLRTNNNGRRTLGPGAGTLSLIVGVALALSPHALAAEASTRPNIVFVLADDLGINDLRCYGRGEHVTPHLDRLASQGMRFTSAYCAQPICSPSRAAIMTGKSPARLHLTTYLPGRRDAPTQKLLHPEIRKELPLEETTLAERLKAAGYATACIGKWHLGQRGFGPREQGFDVYFPGEANTRPSENEGGKGEYALTAAAERFIGENRERPFFLYFCHNSPHIPLAAKAPLIEKHARAFNPTYAAMLETLDASVGRLLARLDELKLADSTLVVFTSDNGGLHVLESPRTPATHNGPFRAGKGFLYEGGLRIPLLVRFLGRITSGVCDSPAINTDWTPTILELAGIRTSDRFDGASLVPLLMGTGSEPRTFYWHFPHYTNQGSRPAGAIREGGYKLIERYEDGRLELFDLSRDPSEQHDRSTDQPDRAREMRDKLAAWRVAVGAQVNRPNPEYDAARSAAIYVDVDVSQLKPAATAAEMAEKLRPWRSAMNAAIRQAP
jgi:arylsulfatase A-like enzyme